MASDDTPFALRARVTLTPLPPGSSTGSEVRIDGAALERLDIDGPVEARVEGERDDHTTTIRGPAFSMSSASSGSSPLSVITVSIALRGATRAKSSRPNFEWSASTTVRRAASMSAFLTLGLGDVGGGEAALDADAVGAHERDVGEDLGDLDAGPLPDGGERAPADDAAEQVQRDVGPRRRARRRPGSSASRR